MIVIFTFTTVIEKCIKKKDERQRAKTRQQRMEQKVADSYFVTF